MGSPRRSETDWTNGSVRFVYGSGAGGSFEIAGIAFEFVPAEHARRAPAGGNRVIVGGATLF